MKTETATPDSIMAKLKARTAHQHEATEATVSLMRPDFNQADYQILLVKFYAFYKGYEAKLSEALRQNPIKLDYANRYNLPRLEADLQSLGMSESEIAEVRAVSDLPALDTADKIFGSLYVIEGSNLGGQVISRHLKEKFGFDETNGAAFFSGNGRETGKMWNEYREAVTEFAEAADDEEIIGAANETFDKIGKALK